MARHTAPPPSDSIPCFATTISGLEALAAAELEEKVGADIRKRSDGLVVFRVPEVDRGLLRLRLVEDLFLFAWGSDALTYRASDLDKLTAWTDKEPKWGRLIAAHAEVRPKAKGKPSFHLVTQLRGEHGYRRIDARKAFAKGVLPHLPHHWIEKEEDAWFEAWLTITGRQAICGIRLSDKTLRHRTFKTEHLPASLRPVAAAAMVRLAGCPPDEWLIDPMCGTGTILGEQLLDDRRAKVLGGDADMPALRATNVNLGHLQDEPLLVKWDATELPFASGSVKYLVTNPPFGRQIGEEEEVGPFYSELVDEFDRVLAPDGKAVILVGDDQALQQAAWKKGWRQEERLRIRLLGHPCFILSWRKG